MRSNYWMLIFSLSLFVMMLSSGLYAVEGDVINLQKKPLTNLKSVRASDLIRREVPSDNGVTTITKPVAPIVPDLRGVSFDRATTILHRNGLTTGVISRRITSGNPDIVLDHYPAAGQRAENRTVNLVLSEFQKVNVPNVVGQPVRSARSSLEKAGFITGAVLPESLKSTGIVSSQKPQADSLAERGSLIELTLIARTMQEIIPEIHDSNNQQVPQPPFKPLRPDITGNQNSGWVNRLLMTGGALLIIGGGALLWSRIHRNSPQSTVEKHADIYAKIDYGNQYLNAESLVPKAFAVKREISILLLPDKGIQEIQGGDGIVVKSD